MVTKGGARSAKGGGKSWQGELGAAPGTMSSEKKRKHAQRGKGRFEAGPASKKSAIKK